MTIVNNTPTNKNFLSPLNFTFVMNRSPHLNFFVQAINIPSVTLGAPLISSPYIAYPIPGEHLKYGDFNITFKVDEDLANYLEVHNWIRGLGKPDNYDEYGNLANTLPASSSGIVSDMTVVILNAIKNPIFEVNFRDAFPTSISELNFASTDSTVNYITAKANFKYTIFDIVKLP
jgi:hypothetical protein